MVNGDAMGTSYNWTDALPLEGLSVLSPALRSTVQKDSEQTADCCLLDTEMAPPTAAQSFWTWTN